MQLNAPQETITWLDICIRLENNWINTSKNAKLVFSSAL